MATALKTQPTEQSINEYLANIQDPQQLKDCQQLIKIMQTATSAKATIWGGRMVGFGQYYYKTKSGCEGNWFITGFATRKQGLTIYIMPGFSITNLENLLAQLGKHKTGKSCLYIKSLADINLAILEKIIHQSVEFMHEKYHTH